MCESCRGLVGQPAVDAMHRYLDDIGRHGNMNLTDSEEVGLFTPLREQAAQLFNCPPEQMAIVASAGEMLSQLPFLFCPPKGSKVIALATDFPAITRPWIAFAERSDLTVQFVQESPDEELTDTLISAIDKHTSVVMVSYVQFSTGSRVDCSRLRDATRAVNARLVLDVTQAAGAVPIDASGWQADVVVCSGYKWLGGHGGVGLAVMSPEFLDQPPPAPGWMGAPDPFHMEATRLPLAEDARRYTQSTMSYISIVGLKVAIDELLKLGAASIEEHSQQLARLLVEELDDCGWRPYRNLTQNAASSHIVTFGHRDADGEATLQKLLDANIICSVRNGRVRISLAHYNSGDDVRAIADALRQAAVV